MFLEGVGIEIFNNFTQISVFSHLNDIVYSPFKLQYLAEISATWQLPPLTQLRMLPGIHSTE